jgi:hypothetical protein
VAATPGHPWAGLIILSGMGLRVIEIDCTLAVVDPVAARHGA